MDAGRSDTLHRTASWVIRNKETGEVIMETFDEKVVDALNTAKYEAAPIGDYLGALNNAIKEAGGEQPPPLFDIPDAGFRLSEEGDKPQTIAEILDQADSDEKAAQALADCLKPGAA